MITSLVANVRAKLELAQRLRTNQSEISSIQATLRELESLASMAGDLVARLHVCQARLGQEALAPLLAQAAQVAQEIDASRQRFATNRRENLPLNNAGRKLQRLTNDLAERWQGYAQARLAPYLELLRLVTYLPEVAASAQEISALVGQIRGQIANSPASEAQLMQFDQRIEELGRRLGAVARLPDEVKIFLGKVVGGAATLADLSPEVLEWITEGGRAAAFSITFVTRRS